MVVQKWSKEGSPSVVYRGRTLAMVINPNAPEKEVTGEGGWEKDMMRSHEWLVTGNRRHVVGEA